MNKFVFGFILSLASFSCASTDSHSTMENHSSMDSHSTMENHSTMDSHSTTGVIKHVENNGKTLVISHQEFPDFMGAMTMPFELLDPGLSKGLEEGDQIEFTIQKTDTGYPIVKISKIEGS